MIKSANREESIMLIVTFLVAVATLEALTASKNDVKLVETRTIS